MIKAYALKASRSDGQSWEHPIAGVTLYVEKDGKCITYTSDEVISMLKALQFISHDSLDTYNLDMMMYPKEE